MIDTIKIISLARGEIQPQSGMEIHFVRVIRGEATACSEEEKTWVEIYKNATQEPDAAILNSLKTTKELILADELAALKRALDRKDEECEQYKLKNDSFLMEELRKFKETIMLLKAEIAEYRFRYGEIEDISACLQEREWRKLDMEELRRWREIRKSMGLPIPEEIERLELYKPEWLRGITGSGPTRGAQWSPADKDGNPI